MEILYGKEVAENIKQDFTKKIDNLVKMEVLPHIAVLGINGDSASDTYIKKIKKNCENYKIDFTLKMADEENEFRDNFNKIKNDDKITGIMFQQPLPKGLINLINEIPAKKDVEGISYDNMGKLFIGNEDALIPCTSRAVIELLDYYNIDLKGKKVVIIGRSNIVGKPLIPQLLAKNATVTICHSKTENLKAETRDADIIIVAIGKPKFLTNEFIKKDAILIDVGINYEDGKLVGDIDFEDIKNKASKCTPVPGGIGIITNSLLISNIIKSCELQIKES